MNELSSTFISTALQKGMKQKLLMLISVDLSPASTKF